GGRDGLVKEPDLEEDALRLSVTGHDLLVHRQTMAVQVADVTLTSPAGATRPLKLDAKQPGVWESTVSANELGLWRASDGKLSALINVGPANPREYSEVTSTTQVLAPLANATGGDARRIEDRGGLEGAR